MTPVFSDGNWIIGFCEGFERRWWDLFTRPGFRHCFAFRYLAPMDAWALIDWGNEGLFVEFMPKRFVDALIAGVTERGGIFIEVKAERQGKRVLPPAWLYCVSAVKDLVGLRDWRVITPWQLYCALSKRGARRMFDLNPIKEDIDGRSIRGQAESAEA